MGADKLNYDAEEELRFNSISPNGGKVAENSTKTGGSISEISIGWSLYGNQHTKEGVQQPPRPK
jgi:hypothetical protein